ncbi:MAG: hypothetical protein Athens071416_267 [Parcubacteria group bacterium Athens0714_16]|nr:MAG: hypothetical protein Athens071416_267 [Parcubacteria group bacterium Athens0714_16]
MSLTKIENKKIVDIFPGKEIKDPCGPPLKDSKKNESESKENQTKDIIKMVWFDLMFNGSGFPISRYD